MLDKIANRYTVESLIGQGGMADVYVARDEILKRQVAIKILREKLADDPLILVRFTREASAASRLSHPNVVDIYDVGESGGLHYIVMEYIKGKTLKQLLAYRGALDLREALSIMKQLVSGVLAAHDNGIIHRDIKPQNVLMKADGTVKITDFGIAVANGAVSLTHNNAVMGSAHYLAPESAQGKTPNAQVDIYSLGIVFYELLSGQVPFAGKSPAEIALKHMQQPIPSIRALNPQIPQSVENIIIKATAKDPKERYQNIKELQYDLNHCLDPKKMNEAPLKLKISSITLGSSENKTPAETKTVKNRKTRRTHTSPAPKVRKRTTALVVAGSITVAFLVCLVLMETGVIRISGILGYKTFPSLTNMTYEQAVETLKNSGFEPEHISQSKAVSDSVPLGEVISADIPAGQVVDSKTKVELIVSKGPSFLVSDYTGQYLSDVEYYFASQGLDINYEIDYQGVKDTNPGIILNQSGLLPGTRIDPDEVQTIHFTVSKYPSIVIPQDLIGMDIDQAVNWLNEQGIAVYAKNISNSSTVQNVDPPVGSEYVQEGTESVVTLYH